MIRAFVLYEGDVDPERYQQHLKDLAKKGQTGYIPAGIAQTDPAKNAETKTQ